MNSWCQGLSRQGLQLLTDFLTPDKSDKPTRKCYHKKNIVLKIRNENQLPRLHQIKGMV